jgi:hypothetical protein
MTQAVLRVEGLPDAPLDAAASFHHVWLPLARDALSGGDLLLVFAAADHCHRAWRLAAVQELAREAAPGRVNGVTGDNEAAIDQATEWLAGAPGITGQLLEVAAA